MNLEYLKVKAKIKNTKRWVKGYYFYKDDKHYIYKNYKINKDRIYEIDPETICRLVYKNNKKEIWENDIIKLYFESEKRKIDVIGIVRKRNWRFITQIIQNNSYYKINNKVLNFDDYWWGANLLAQPINELKVIGNVIDNPELLKMD